MPEILSPFPPKWPSSEGAVGAGRAINLTQLLGQTSRTAYPEPGAESQQQTTAAAVVEHLAQQLDAAQQQSLARYTEQLEGRLQELRQAMEISQQQSQQAVLSRVEDLSCALHRDMNSFRQEQQREMEDLKRDVFTAVMSLSAINDRVSATESQLHQRVDQLQHTLATFIQHSRLTSSLPTLP